MVPLLIFVVIGLSIGVLGAVSRKKGEPVEWGISLFFLAASALVGLLVGFLIASGMIYLTPGALSVRAHAEPISGADGQIVTYVETVFDNHAIYPFDLLVKKEVLVNVDLR